MHEPRAGCAECERFMEVADADRRARSPWLRVLPFGRWLDRHGFGARFREDVLAPVLSCLFITKSGMWHQSTEFMFNMMPVEAFYSALSPGIVRAAFTAPWTGLSFQRIAFFAIPVAGLGRTNSWTPRTARSRGR